MRKHRTPKQWQTLVDQQRASGLSASQFCKQENIGYASFCNWRKRLAGSSTDEAAGSGDASFLDLSSLMEQEHHPAPVPDQGLAGAQAPQWSPPPPLWQDC